MSEFIHVIKAEVTGWESDIALLEHPHIWRVPGSDKDPLANIKLSIENNHRVLYVFLNDILASIIIVISTANLLNLL